MARVQNNKQSYWDKINKNELNSIHACMTTLLVRSEMIILSRWLLFTASRFPHLIISPDLMTKQKREAVPKNRSNWIIWARKYKKWFQLLILLRKIKKPMSHYRDTRPPKRGISRKVTLDIGSFIDEPVV